MQGLIRVIIAQLLWQVHMRFQENSSMSIMYAVKRLCPHQRWWHDTPTQWVLHLEALPQLFRNFLEEGLDFTQNCGLTQLLQVCRHSMIIEVRSQQVSCLALPSPQLSSRNDNSQHLDIWKHDWAYSRVC